MAVVAGSAAVTPSALAERVIAGKFRLEACIGQSMDALLFRARQSNLERDVALKILLAEPSNDWQLGARLRREAQLIAGLRHPGLAAVFDEGVTEDGLPFIVMELLKGETLKDYLESMGRPSPGDAVQI